MPWKAIDVIVGLTWKMPALPVIGTIASAMPLVNGPITASTLASTSSCADFSAVSRFCATVVFAKLDYVRAEGKAKPFNQRVRDHELALAALPALLPLFFLPFWPVVFALLFAGGATYWLARLFEKRIGGYTGDCLGATQQFAELAFYGGLLCRFS